MKRHLLYKPIDLSEFKTMSRRKEGASFRRLCLNLYKALHGHRDHPQQQQQIIIIIKTGIHNYCSLITFNINGLNSPVNILRLSKKLFENRLYLSATSKKTHLNIKDRHHLRIKGFEKDISSKWT